VSWFLQKSNGVEYGPTDLETLRAWAADGRIAADDLISRDRATWTPASKEVLLEIEWVVTTDQGDAGGPCHLRLFSEWLREGVLSPDTVVRNVRNGRRVVLGELFPDLVATLTAASRAFVGFGPRRCVRDRNRGMGGVRRRGGAVRRWNCRTAGTDHLAGAGT